MPPSSRDTAPDLTPETLPGAAAETHRGHGGAIHDPPESAAARSTVPHAEPHATRGSVTPEVVAPEVVAVEAAPSGVAIIERPPHTTQGGTQISSLSPDERRTLFETAPSQQAPSQDPTSSDRSRSLADSRMMEERFRRIEHRLDQLDARMRLLEKGAEWSGLGSRAGLLWWGLVLLLAILWGVSTRG